MKEIKFRGWDKINKMMFFPYSIDLVENHMGIKQGQYYFDTSAIDFKDAFLMQFTCLKDKNGKEIWESDIVMFQRKILIVIKDGGGYGLTDIGTNSFGPLDWLIPPNEIEVIGNIYENKDLFDETV